MNTWQANVVDHLRAAGTGHAKVDLIEAFCDDSNPSPAQLMQWAKANLQPGTLKKFVAAMEKKDRPPAPPLPETPPLTLTNPPPPTRVRAQTYSRISVV